MLDHTEFIAFFKKKTTNQSVYKKKNIGLLCKMCVWGEEHLIKMTEEQDKQGQKQYVM